MEPRKPLPPYAGNIAFSGLVGKFNLSAHLEDTQINVGDATTLSVTVEGTGNIMDAVFPQVVVPDAFKVYADTPEEEVRLEADGFTGSKVFRNALVAIKEGAYALGPFKLCYFDVAQGDYQVVAAPAVSVKAIARSYLTSACGKLGRLCALAVDQPCLTRALYMTPEASVSR